MTHLYAENKRENTIINQFTPFPNQLIQHRLSLLPLLENVELGAVYFQIAEVEPTVQFMLNIQAEASNSSD